AAVATAVAAGADVVGAEAAAASCRRR
ncbi:MAG: hypothetical protein JWP17_3987, partial [Solirubrobacterales bacterium]|nr:hypothetical protein [Solirubrobacterales bacterium]